MEIIIIFYRRNAWYKHILAKEAEFDCPKNGEIAASDTTLRSL